SLPYVRLAGAPQVVLRPAATKSRTLRRTLGKSRGRTRKHTPGRRRGICLRLHRRSHVGTPDETSTQADTEQQFVKHGYSSSFLGLHACISSCCLLDGTGS